MSGFEIVLSIFLIGILVCAAALTLCVCKSIETISKFDVSSLLKAISNVKTQGPSQSYTERPQQVTGEGGRASKKEAPAARSLKPEEIAPRLRKPPRAKGGFGSRVDKDDGDT